MRQARCLFTLGGQSHRMSKTSSEEPTMLSETWNQEAEWEVETIKNIQTHVGVAEEDRHFAPHARKGASRLALPGGRVHLLQWRRSLACRGSERGEQTKTRKINHSSWLLQEGSRG